MGMGVLGAEIPAVGRNNYLKQMLMTENVIPSALLEKKIKVIKAHSLYHISSHSTEIPKRALAPSLLPLKMVDLEPLIGEV